MVLELPNWYERSNTMRNNNEYDPERDEDIFTLEIVDDGVGIENKKKSGNGLYNMERRMNSIEGSFKIKPSKKGLHLLFQVQL